MSLLVYIVIASIFGFSLLLAIYFLIIEGYALFANHYNNNNKKRNRIFILTQTFYDSLLPTELSGQVWTVRLFNIIVERHPIVRLFLPKNSVSRLPYLLDVTVQAVNYALVSVLLVEYIFDYRDHCLELQSSVDCESYSHHSAIFFAMPANCIWNTPENACDAESFHVLSKSIIVALVLILTCTFNRVTINLGRPFHELINRLSSRKVASIGIGDDQQQQQLHYPSPGGVRVNNNNFSNDVGSDNNSQTNTDSHTVIVNNGNIVTNGITLTNINSAGVNDTATLKNDAKDHEDVLEFGCLQSLQSTIMRAASMELMFISAEGVSLAAEAITLVNNVLNLDQSINVDFSGDIEDESGYQQLRSLKIDYEKNDLSSTLQLFKLDELLTTDASIFSKNSRLIKSYRMHTIMASRKLRIARQEANAIKNYFSSVELTDYQKNVYLVQQFLLGQLGDINTWHVRKLFMKEGMCCDMDRLSIWNVMWQYCSPVILFCYLGIAFRFVFRWGSSFQRNQAGSLWCYGFLLSWTFEILFLANIRLLLSRVVMPSIRNHRLRVLHGLLRERTNSIMKRRFHLLRAHKSLVQHFNPACRAARMFPSLPVSRLLMSLSDFDLPDSIIKKPQPVVISKDVDYVINEMMKLIERYLPPILMELTLDFFVAFVFCFIMLVISIIWHEASWVAGVVITIVLIVFVIYALVFHRYKVKSPMSRVIRPVDADLNRTILSQRQGDIVAGSIHEQGGLELLNRGNYRKYWYTGGQRKSNYKPRKIPAIAPPMSTLEESTISGRSKSREVLTDEEKLTSFVTPTELSPRELEYRRKMEKHFIPKVHFIPRMVPNSSSRQSPTGRSDGGSTTGIRNSSSSSRESPIESSVPTVYAPEAEVNLEYSNRSTKSSSINAELADLLPKPSWSPSQKSIATSGESEHAIKSLFSRKLADM